MNAYFISGLGADRRAFDRLKLPDDIQVHHIDWLEPHAEETLEHYARRMAANIDREKPFFLVGLSFGGIISIEIGKFLFPRKIFLISSVSCRAELPWYVRAAGNLHIHRSGFAEKLKSSRSLMNWFFGVRPGRMSDYLVERIEAMSTYYLRWSLDQIMHWQQKEKPREVFHIHGTRDKLFPIRFVHADAVVEGGSHFMVVTHARAVAAYMSKELKFDQEV